MFFRLRQLSYRHSFFLFGPRGTGKSTVIRERFSEAIVLSQDRFTKKLAHVTCYPWQEGLALCFPEIKTTPVNTK